MVLDPDSESGFGSTDPIESGSNPDPDPQPWLQGCVKVGDSLEIPSVAAPKKVKSIQMFRVSVDRIGPGDRAGVCVTQFESSLLERGLVCSPGAVPVAFCAIVDLQPIPYYKGEVRSKAKFHISLGHDKVMARITIFSRPKKAQNNSSPGVELTGSGFNFDEEYKFEECHTSADPANQEVDKFALLEFERAVAVVPGCIVIGSKLDSDINANLCRLTFHGRARWQTGDKHYAKTELPRLKVYKDKSREGTAERAANEYEVIVRDLFKKETSLDLFVGLRVGLSSGETGLIEGTFGQSGKVKVRVREGLQAATLAALGGKKKKGEAATAAANSEPIRVVLKFKRYIFDPKKQMIQS
jgi:selenocysteine-specific elongation factor